MGLACFIPGVKHEWEVLTKGESTSRSSLWFKWRCARCGKVVEQKPPDDARDSVPPVDEFPCVGTGTHPKVSVKKRGPQG